MLIVIHVQIARVDSATASVLWNLIEIGWLVMAVQTVLVRRPGNVGLLQITLQWIFEHLRRTCLVPLSLGALLFPMSWAFRFALAVAYDSDCRLRSFPL